MPDTQLLNIAFFTPRLSEDLRRILLQADGKDVSFHQILRMIRGRGFPCLLIFLVLPFLVPVPLPGLSVPIGLVLMLFGIWIAIGKRPFLPQWFLERHISYPILERILLKAIPLITYMEKLLHPRMHFFTRWRVFQLVNGFAIMINGVALMLPLPIPFTNTIPAIAVALLSAGVMEKDGLFILLGYFVTLSAWGYLLLLSWMGYHSFEVLKHNF